MIITSLIWLTALKIHCITTQVGNGFGPSNRIAQCSVKKALENLVHVVCLLEESLVHVGPKNRIAQVLFPFRNTRSTRTPPPSPPGIVLCNVCPTALQDVIDYFHLFGSFPIPILAAISVTSTQSGSIGNSI